MDSFLAQLSAVVPAAKTLEELTRPLLDMLAVATGMESTYLTAVDSEANLQQVQFARNADADFTIPEGLSVPWADTLCKRALDEGRPFTDQVADRWGDSDAARALGIRSYVSAPIRGDDGELIGTLCAASPQRRPLAPGAENMLRLFSTLIGQLVQRDRLVERLRASNTTLASYALTDPLTGLPNRRALVDELQRLLARGVREHGRVLVGLIDLDGFKAINDTHGHALGDAFLQHAAQRLAGALRATDMLARLGGDEFVIVGPAPAQHADAAARALQARCEAVLVGPFASGEVGFHYAGASAGVIAVDPQGVNADDALRLADAAMYDVKRLRRLALAARLLAEPLAAVARG
ncbi:GGDEF domain-containing protein [Aquabacterium sp.]|uniref:GGDEF domain-containing protein n=1 Tax=Aquabacterium sp. TaxID=1872578 RepID=UPI0037831ACF